MTTVRLQGTSVLLTGASGGLGPHMARAIAAAGASLALVGRSRDRLAALQAELRGSGICAETLVCDLGAPGAVEDLAVAAEAAVGPIDALVNNAGVEVAAPFTTLDPTEIDQLLALDLAIPLLLTRRLLPGMLARGRGHVVNISSIGGKGAIPYSVPYAAAKWGLIGVTQSLRAEYADAPIGFSVVCPGFVAGEGMFGRAAARGVRAPAAFGTTTAPKVAAAVVRSIEHDLPEVIVTPRPVRPLLAFAALAPRTSERLATRLGTTRFARDAARAQRRL